MRKHLLGLMLVAGLAGCSSEPDIALSAAAADGAAASAAPTQARLAKLRGASASFAALPDRGELLSYGGARKVRQSGAYTYHPVAISEAHALNAIGAGEMVVNMPDGKPLRVKYERHEEQPDGNWTWIGRNADGSSAVLTFGEKAVFGMVSRGDDYYRVRTDRTGAWVVATDRSLVASNGGRRQAGPDFLLPPEGRALAAAASRHMAKVASDEAGAAKAVGTEKAAAVIDVLVGYSNGLASVYGSQAAASTFVTSLAAITNVAYSNSGVNMRLRVVRTLQVNYADTSDNEATLEQMTGYDASAQQPITPNAAFNALRAARNEYGADLVAFVRQYREPEQDGCGIAWLLGMNQSGITAADDAEFGYAVVSDGEDRDESDGNTYFCSDFSLAHELGHLMGQAHNSEDAQGRAGAHTYSYGYREASSTGFFTIMAYPAGDAQLEIPHFGNPSVNYQSRPTGSATANNVASMNLTMPVISGFRATVVPLVRVRRDVNGNGTSDLFWLGGTTKFAHWLMSGATVSYRSPSRNVTGYTYVGTGDLTGDGRSDIVWTGADGVWLWPSTGNVFGTAVKITNPISGWRIVGIADLNGDGSDDLLWHNATTKRFSYWRMNGNVATYQSPSSDVGAYNLVATGDFNGDGFEDLVWSNGATLWLWRSETNGGFTQLRIGSHPAGWTLKGAVDLNGDGRGDLLWYNATQKKFAYWRMNGHVVSSQSASSNVTDYQLYAFGDFNGDSYGDLVWTNNSRIWLWAGSETGAFTNTQIGTHPAGWRIR